MYFSIPTVAEVGEDDYQVACLLMVFVAVAIPKLARSDMSFYKASLEGHANNIHCLAKAINALAGALFTIHGPGDTEDRLKEFLAVGDCVNFEVPYSIPLNIDTHKLTCNFFKFSPPK